MISLVVFFTDFKTEEDLLSYIHENYQKTVAAGEITLHSCARNMISTIKAFLKSKGTKELEVREYGCCCHRWNGWLLTGGFGSLVLGSDYYVMCGSQVRLSKRVNISPDLGRWTW